MPLSCSLRLRLSTRWLLAALLGVVFLATSSARASIDIYAKLGDATGVYMGEVKTPAAYAGWTPVQSLSFGFSNNVNPDGSTGTGGFKASPSNVGVLRSVDRVSPQLFFNTVSGAGIGGTKNSTTIGLTIVFYDSETNTERMKLECKGVFVTSVSSGGGSGSGLPTESVGFAYSSFRMTVLDSSGSAVMTSWNFTNNNPNF